MIIAVIAVVLFGILGITAKKQMEKIRNQRDQLKQLSQVRQAERGLLQAKDFWLEKYIDVRGQIPVFGTNVIVSTHWQKQVDQLAREHDVNINRWQPQPGREILIGDVHEFPIVCTDWEGSLESFVKFMFALQSQGAMLDMRELTIRPHRQKAGVLQGSFVLYCAFMRGTEENL